MRTYQEKVKGTVTDWPDYLDRVRKGDVDSDEAEKYSILAGSWVTCACGNQCDIIPRTIRSNKTYEVGAPKDYALRELGMNFFSKIEDIENMIKNEQDPDNFVDQAEDILHKIEQRSEEILYRTK